MKTPRTRLEAAAAAQGIHITLTEHGYFVLVHPDQPHGLGVAVEIRGTEYARLPDELVEPEVTTTDADVVIGWLELV